MQGALTMAGNTGMCVAAAELAASGGGGSGGKEGEGGEGGEAATAAGAWYNFDVEGFAPLWVEDKDATFSGKIALLSLTVAALIRAASLAVGPHFCDPGVGYNVAEVTEVSAAAVGAAGEWVGARGAVAGVMVAVPLALNIAKWGYRQSSIVESSSSSPAVAIQAGDSGPESESSKMMDTAGIERGKKAVATAPRTR